MKKKSHNKFTKRNIDSYKREVKSNELRTGQRERFIVISFKDFDGNQGQSFEDWEAENLLALVVRKLQGVCSLTKNEATQKQIIKAYPKGTFPEKSDFYHPKHIPEDIAWCSMHIQGKECVIGYFDDNVFYIVFLDKDHRFWITEKKHT